MIKGFFFLVAVFAVLWLGLWVARAERGKPGRPAPFDMREPHPGPESVRINSPPSMARRARATRTRHPG